MSSHSDSLSLNISRISISTMLAIEMCLCPLTPHGQGNFPEVPTQIQQPKEQWRQSLGTPPNTPNYDQPDAWAICPPLRHDAPLKSPKTKRHQHYISNSSTSELADVFFIHPTMYMNGDPWNAGIDDPTLNREVDRWPIRHQASVFQSCARIFAPRYRQAHIRIFRLGDSLSHAAARLAYDDVRNAFQHYLEHWNDGKPIILAGHSQGSYHGRTLIQEFFDGKPLQSQLVAAYLPGMDLYPSDFRSINLCQRPEETGCICTWMTYGKGYLPPWLGSDTSKSNEPPMVVNPVTFDVMRPKNDWHEHLGVVRPSFRLSHPEVIQARVIEEGVLWIDIPQVLGGKKLQRENWHSGDYNLFWVNITNNATGRCHAWFLDHENKRGHLPPVVDQP